MVYAGIPARYPARALAISPEEYLESSCPVKMVSEIRGALVWQASRSTYISVLAEMAGYTRDLLARRKMDAFRSKDNAAHAITIRQPVIII